MASPDPAEIAPEAEKTCECCRACCCSSNSCCSRLCFNRLGWMWAIPSAHETVDAKPQMRMSLPVMLALALTFFVIGATSLGIWYMTGWFHDAYYDQNKWRGYNKGFFVALVFFTYFMPLAFAFGFTYLQFRRRFAATNPEPQSYRKFTSITVGIMIVLIGLCAYWMHYALGSCFFLFCINTEDHTWKPPFPKQPEAGRGWLAFVGMSYFAGAVAVIVGAVYSYLQHRKHEAFHHSGVARADDVASASSAPSGPASGGSRGSGAAGSGSAGVMLPGGATALLSDRDDDVDGSGFRGNGKASKTAASPSSGPSAKPPVVGRAVMTSAPPTILGDRPPRSDVDVDVDVDPTREPPSTRRRAFNTDMHPALSSTGAPPVNTGSLRKGEASGSQSVNGAGQSSRIPSTASLGDSASFALAANTGGYASLEAHPVSAAALAAAQGPNSGLRSGSSGLSSLREYSGSAAQPVVHSVSVSLSSTGVAWYLMYCCFIGTCWLFSMYLPGNWEYWSPNRIATRAAITVPAVVNNYTCNDWPTNTCPEWPGAYFKTIPIKLTPTFTLKLFPGNTFFFVFLLLVPLFALVLRSYEALDRWFDKKILIPLTVTSFLKGITEALLRGKCHSPPRSRAYFSRKELIMFLMLLTMVTLFILYWALDHNFVNKWPDVEVKHVKWSERAARTMGLVASMFFSLLLFPAARNSPIYSLLGVSWEGSIQYHRWIGTVFLLAAALHMCLSYWWFAQEGHFPEDIISVPMTLPESIDNFTTPLMIVITWMCFITIGVMSWFESIRRKTFELFWYLHTISYYVMTPAILWHATNGWHMILPALVIFTIDRGIRAYRSSKAVHLLDARVTVHGEKNSAVAQRVATGTAVEYGVAGEIVHIRVAAGCMSYLPGQYAFINVAELSLLEWHPFTISSPVHPNARDEVTFHIKNMGPGTWTGRLYEHVKEGNPITVSLDGPYGHPIDFRKYSTVLLVAGGIGLTPVKSIFESMRLSYLHDDPVTAASAAAASSTPTPSSSASSAAAASSDAANIAAPIKKPGFFDTESATVVTGPGLSAIPKRVHLLMCGRDPSLFDIMRESLHDLPSGPFTARLHVDVPPPVPGAPAGPKSPSFSEMKAPTGIDAAGQRIESGSSLGAAGALAAMILRHRPDFENSLGPIVQRIDGMANPHYISLPSQARQSAMAVGSGVSAETLQSEVEQQFGPLPPASDTILFVCGPPGMTAACEDLAWKKGWAFHTETFAL